MNEEEIVKKLKGKNLFGLGYGSKICEWCGIFTTVLHKHHYPISRKDGGTKTVKICPNCHNEFHHPLPLKIYILRVRVNKKMKEQILTECKRLDLSVSELTRLLWIDYFKKVDEKTWKEETKDW